MKRSKHNPNDAFHRLNLILPQGLAEKLYLWHGGQFSAVYSLASTGDHSYVSQSMIEKAIRELENIKRSGKATQTGSPYKIPAKDWKHLKETISDLHMVLNYPDEFSTKAAGVGDKDAGYSYSNPRKRKAARRNPIIFGKRITPKRKRGHILFSHPKRDYHIDGISRKEAAKYLVLVREAELSGERIPRGPNGITKSAAGALLRFGNLKAKHKKAKKRVLHVRPKRAKATPRPKVAKPIRQKPRGPQQDAWDVTQTTFSFR